jgi:indole-3-glycerol phosphate synthase
MDEWMDRAAATRAPVAFDEALRAPGLSVIAEIKRRSPSAGDIAPDLDPALLAVAYEAGGAAAISVLTEPDHFGGSLSDLEAVEAVSGLPLLRKDFILHPVQIAQGRALGADTVLLIAAVLDDPTLASLIETAKGLGMVALVEAHDGEEVARAAAAGARVIGVNNRDLRTFEVDLGTAERLRGVIPAGVVAVAEGGVTSDEGARRMYHAGYDAILVGQAAATAQDPASFVAGLREAS